MRLRRSDHQAEPGSSYDMIEATNLWHDERMKNFHVPLPEQTYDQLRMAAERAKMPATVAAREAIDSWLRQQLRKERHQAIAAYAAEMAGTALDLDTELEAAGIEHLAKTDKGAK